MDKSIESKIIKLQEERVRHESEINLRKAKIAETDKKIEQLELQAIKNILTEKELSLSQAIQLLKGGYKND